MFIIEGEMLIYFVNHIWNLTRLNVKNMDDV